MSKSKQTETPQVYTRRRCQKNIFYRGLQVRGQIFVRRKCLKFANLRQTCVIDIKQY